MKNSIINRFVGWGWLTLLMIITLIVAFFQTPYYMMNTAWYQKSSEAYCKIYIDTQNYKWPYINIYDYENNIIAKGRIIFCTGSYMWVRISNREGQSESVSYKLITDSSQPHE